MTAPAHHSRSKLAEIGLQPRGLTRDEAAAYAGCKTAEAFDDWVRRNIIPGPIPGTHRWDRKAIDAALDRASGLNANVAPTAFAEWRAKRDARAS